MTKYVTRPGEMSHLQPAACRNARLYGFFLDGDAATIQSRLVDPILNAPSGGNPRYKVVSDRVMISFTLAAECRGTRAPDDAIGLTREGSWVVWVPLAAVNPFGLPRLLSYPAYICVDNAWSLAVGREVYGFPKNMGEIAMPPAGAAQLDFEVSTMVMPHYDPAKFTEHRTLMSVEQVGPALPDALTFAEPAQAIDQVLQAWLGDAAAAALGTFTGAVTELFNPLDVRAVFLKQFRDAADGTKACYQAIVEAPSKVTALHGGGQLGASFAATIADYQSHPLASDLGIAPGRTALKNPFWVHYDFLCDNGTTVWKA